MTGSGPQTGNSVPGTARMHGNQIAIVLADLTAALAALEDAERSTPRLSADQHARFADLTARGNRQAQTWRAAHIALRIVLERHAGACVRGVCYTLEPGGRPHLPVTPEWMDPPQFSLSHTGGFALIAVATTEPVGIDLECPRTVRLAPERRQPIEAAAQRLAMSEPLPDAADDRFLQAWVRLEATAKATGEGMGRLLSKAGAIGAGFAASAASKRGGDPVASVTVRDLDLGHNCFAAIAARTLPASLLVEVLPADTAGLAAFLSTAVVRTGVGPSVGPRLDQ